MMLIVNKLQPQQEGVPLEADLGFRAEVTYSYWQPLSLE